MVIGADEVTGRRDVTTHQGPALEKAAQQKRKAAAAATAAKKSQEMDDSVEIHAPEEGLQVPPIKRRDDGSSKKLDSTKRADSAT